MKYMTINDLAEREVSPALGDYVDDFDVDAIAADISEWRDGSLVLKPVYDEGSKEYVSDAFWTVVRSHEL